MRAAVVGAILLATGCGRRPDRGDQVRLADSAGVVIVTNPGTDRPFPLGLERLFRVEAGNESFTIDKVYEFGVVAGPWGIAVVTDDWLIAQFDTLGNYRRMLGRKGAGPGEFTFPVWIGADPEGVVGVFDFNKSTLVRFTAEGRVLPEVRHSAFQQIYRGATRRGDSLLLVVLDPAPVGAHGTMRAKLFTPTDTLVLASKERPGPADLVDFKCVALAGQPPMLWPDLLATWTDSTMVVVADAGYELSLFRRGKLVGLVRRAVRLEPASAATVRRLFPEGQVIGFGARSCTIPPEDLAAKHGVAAVVPALSDLRAGPDGTIWALRYAFADTPPHYDVLTASGRYLGTVIAPGKLAAFATKTIALFVEPDSTTGGNHLVGYQVRWPSQGIPVRE